MCVCVYVITSSIKYHRVRVTNARERVFFCFFFSAFLEHNFRNFRTFEEEKARFAAPEGVRFVLSLSASDDRTQKSGAQSFGGPV